MSDLGINKKDSIVIRDLKLYNRRFELNSDPELKAAGVFIAAQSVEDDEFEVTNHVQVRNDDRIAHIYCIHTAIAHYKTKVISEMTEDDFIDLAISTEQYGPVNISLEEHFFALCSFVEGIVEYGIMNAIADSFQSEQVNPLEMKVGFNDLLQSGFLKALIQVAPSPMRDLHRKFTINLIESAPAAWLLDRFPRLINMYILRDILNEEEVSEALYCKFESPEERSKLVFWIWKDCGKFTPTMHKLLRDADICDVASRAFRNMTFSKYGISLDKRGLLQVTYSTAEKESLVDFNGFLRQVTEPIHLDLNEIEEVRRQTRTIEAERSFVQLSKNKTVFWTGFGTAILAAISILIMVIGLSSTAANSIIVAMYGVAGCWISLMITATAIDWDALRDHFNRRIKLKITSY